MLTQDEIAADVGLSQPAIARVLRHLKLKKSQWSVLPLAEVRKLIVRHYSECAAGRGGDAQFRLSEARARESQLKGDLLEIQIGEKTRSLIPAEIVSVTWGGMTSAARARLLAMPYRLASAAVSADGNFAEIEYAAGNLIREVLEELHSYDPNDYTPPGTRWPGT
jgi:hypothetical protein